MTLLHVAADRGYFYICEFLISQGAEVNAQDENGETPLHLAAVSCHPACVELLLKAGSDRYSRNIDHQTPSDATDSAEIRSILI